ncbi:MAG: hypothetical protein AAFU65_02590, partial [Pseudomonadota bacterium]
GDDEVGGWDVAGRFGIVDDVDIPSGNPGDITIADGNPCFDLFAPDIGFLWVEGSGLTGVTVDPAGGLLSLFDASMDGECDHTDGVIIEIIP